MAAAGGSISGRSTTFQFKANPYSTYNRRTHFTPIWYPDGSYTPYTWLLDCWTPAGMLSMNLTDSVTIRGNLWEEWHIAPQNNNRNGGIYEQHEMQTPLCALVLSLLLVCVMGTTAFAAAQAMWPVRWKAPGRRHPVRSRPW